MPDTILDDVNALILKEKGDKRILEQIKRAAENNEVISIYERNYVAKLKGELEKKPEPRHKPLSPSVQASVIPRSVPYKPVLVAPLKQRRKKPKTIKIAAMAGGIALIAAVVIGILMYGVDIDIGPEPPDLTPTPTPPTPITKPPDPTPPPIPSLGDLLSIDDASYSLGDIISISGKSDTSLGDQVVLSIENPDNALVWNESVPLRSDGEFSTLAIAGGSGWGNPGEYTLTIQYGKQTESLDFNFEG